MDPQSQQQLASLQRRRAVLDALMGQSLQPRQTQFAGRLAVPVTPLQGLTQIASAFLAKRGSDKLDKQESDITSGYQSKVADAYKRIAAAMNPQQQQPQPQMPAMSDPANFPGIDPSLLTVPEGVGRRMTEIPGGGFYGNAPNVPNDMAIQPRPIAENEAPPVDVTASRQQPAQPQQRMTLEKYLERVTAVSQETGIPVQTLMDSPIVKAQIEALQKQAEPFTLGEGQKRFMGGQVVAEGGAKLTDIEQLATGYQRAMEARDFATARAIEAEMASKGLSNIMKDEYTGKVYAMKGNELVQLGSLTPKPEGTTEVYDPSSPSQTRLVKQSEAIGKPGAAKVKATNVTTNVNTGDSLTPGQKKVDEEYAKEFVAWDAQGGYADTQKGLEQLRSARESLASQNVTGPVTGSIPDAVNQFVNPRAIAVREEVEEVVQRNLRLVLGPQFTEKEGERLIKRSYNPNLSEQENMVRLDRLIRSIEEAAKAKQEAADYFREHGTLRGWSGRLPTLSDLERAVDGNTDPNIKILRREGG
jgi:hypothetical protein